jgi:hypothetical protein
LHSLLDQSGMLPGSPHTDTIATVSPWGALHAQLHADGFHVV